MIVLDLHTYKFYNHNDNLDVYFKLINLSHNLQCPESMISDQLVSETNQIWLEKIIKSNAVQMIVTRCATSVLEVDQEHQGDLIVAMDPLTIGKMVGGLATSSFAIWRHQSGLEMDDSCRSVLGQDDHLVCAGLVMYGHQTRVVMAGEGGCSEYILDRRVGQLVLVDRRMESGDKMIMSLPPVMDQSVRETVSRLSGHMSPSESVIARTGVAGVDCMTVIKNGGIWTSDQDLGYLYQAVPLAFIGSIVSK